MCAVRWTAVEAKPPPTADTLTTPEKRRGRGRPRKKAVEEDVHSSVASVSPPSSRLQAFPSTTLPPGAGSEAKVHFFLPRVAFRILITILGFL